MSPTNSFIVEVTGDEEKIEGLVEVLRPFGIIEMVRTGMVSMARGVTRQPMLFSTQRTRSAKQ